MAKHIPPEVKRQIIRDFAGSEDKHGSVEAQVGFLSYRIEILQEHLARNKKDMVAKKALINLVSRRRRLLKYLARRKPEIVPELLEKAGLRLKEGILK